MKIITDIEKLKNITCLVFDMDGVITSEERYWDCAGLGVAEIVEKYLGVKENDIGNIKSLEDLVKLRKKYLTDDEIIALKNLAVNTNWDVAYIATSIRIINAISKLETEKIVPKNEGIDTEYLKTLGKYLEGHEINSKDLEKPLTIKKFVNYMKENKKKGFEVIDSINNFLPDKLFKRKDKLWMLCKDIFQKWYLGDEQNRGMIHYENLLLDEKRIKKTLSNLKDMELELKIATGRPYNELIIPLKKAKILVFFSAEDIATNDDIEKTESVLKNKGVHISMAKPNPYLFLRAIHGAEIDNEFIRLNGKVRYNKGDYKKFAVVGDAVSDMVAAKEMGCAAIGVLTGAFLDKNKKSLEKELINNGADAIIDDLTFLVGIFRP